MGKALFWPVLSRNKLSATINARRLTARRWSSWSKMRTSCWKISGPAPWSAGAKLRRSFGHQSELIMIRVSGFGQTGPYAKRAGYGAIGRRWAACATTESIPTAQ